MKQPTNRLPISHPVLAEITLPVERFYYFSCLVDNSNDVRIMGYSDPECGMIIVRIACLDENVAEAMERGWA